MGLNYTPEFYSAILYFTPALFPMLLNYTPAESNHQSDISSSSRSKRKKLSAAGWGDTGRCLWELGTPSPLHDSISVVVCRVHGLELDRSFLVPGGSISWCPSVRSDMAVGERQKLKRALVAVVLALAAAHSFKTNVTRDSPGSGKGEGRGRPRLSPALGLP